ncbi:MAG: Flp family type IVb pilin [Pseudomonadota bacterium]
MFRRFLRDERGGTAIEYALIATILSLVIVGGISTVLTKLQSEYTDVNSKVNQAIR